MTEFTYAPSTEVLQRKYEAAKAEANHVEQLRLQAAARLDKANKKLREAQVRDRWQAFQLPFEEAQPGQCIAVSGLPRNWYAGRSMFHLAAPTTFGWLLHESGYGMGYVLSSLDGRVGIVGNGWSDNVDIKDEQEIVFLPESFSKSEGLNAPRLKNLSSDLLLPTFDYEKMEWKS